MTDFIVNPWEVNTAKYDSKSFSISSQETFSFGVFFKPDGTKMYIIGGNSDKVHQYSLSTPWDVSSASYDDKYFDVSSQDGIHMGLFFKSDGTKMYTVGGTNDSVYQYTLSTAWDVSTATYDDISFYVGSQDNSPHSVFFNPDGTKMYFMGADIRTCRQYSLSTAWDVSTASYDKRLSVGTQDSVPYGLFFKPDGTKMYVLGFSAKKVLQYSLSTAWDVSTATYDDISFYVGSQDNGPTGLFFKPDGTKMYMIGWTDKVYQYSLSGIKESISLSDNLLRKFIGNRLISEYLNLSDLKYIKGNLNKLISESLNLSDILQYRIGEIFYVNAWEVDTISYDSKYKDVSAQDAQPYGVSFNSDGTKMYMVGVNSDKVYQYSLSTPWDVSTASYDTKSFSVSSQDGYPRLAFFNSNGTKMYMLGGDNNAVFQYSLSTAWDISNVSYDNKSFSLGSQDAESRAFFFKPDGTKMYYGGSANDSVYQYTLSTPWDVSTLSYDSKSFYVGDKDIDIHGISFNQNGTKMYIAGNANDIVFQYSLSTPWDISTASYEKSKDVSAQDERLFAFFFKPDGTKMYTVGTTNKSIFQYSLKSGITESVSLIENLLKNLIKNKLISDSISLTDICYKKGILNKLISESLSLSDAISKKWILNRLISESLSLSDVKYVKGNLNRIITESISLSDLKYVKGNLNRFIIENLTLSDNFSRKFTGNKSITESISLSDVYSRQVIFRRYFSDSLNLTDNLIVIPWLNKYLSLIDNFNLSDNLSKQSILNLYFSDNFSLNELYYFQKFINKYLSESITTLDSVIAVISRNILIKDLLNMSDLLSMKLLYRRCERLQKMFNGRYQNSKMGRVLSTNKRLIKIV